MGVHTYFEYFSVYLETARSTTASTLTFTIATGGTWKIKVSQIECSSTSRGYPDCDQFFTGISGQVASFNWPNVQLQSKDYTYCIRREQGITFCPSTLVTQPMLQLRPNCSELRLMDYYHQIFCRFRKCKRKVPPPSPLSTQKLPFTPPKEDFSHPLGG